MEYKLNSNLEENFNKALNLCEAELSHEGLINLLREGDVPERQFAALSLDSLIGEDDVKAFMSNLTGCDGKIREAVASRLDEFLTDETKLLFTPYYEVFADATIDINANISRMVIDALQKLILDADFGKNYSTILVRFMNEAFDEISKIKFRDKKYVINKQLFKMYWALEGLVGFYAYVEKSVLYEILAKVLERPEYTIREKAAEVLVKVADFAEFSSLVEIVSKDENFYVRRVLEKLEV